MIKEALKQYIEIAVANASGKGLLDPMVELTVPIVIERARKPSFGDYACGLPLRLEARTGIASFRIAEILCNILNADMGQFANAEPDKRGFLNFRLKDLALQNVLRVIHDSGESFGSCRLGSGKSASLTCVLPDNEILNIDEHRARVYAENLSRLLEFCGYELFTNIKDTGKYPEESRTYDAAFAVQSIKTTPRLNEWRNWEHLSAEFGSAALRYFLAKPAARLPVNFDLELANLCGRTNPFFTIQYAYARCAAMLRQALEPIIDFDNGVQMTALVSAAEWGRWQLLYAQSTASFAPLFDAKHIEQSCKSLIITLAQFPGEIKSALKEEHPGRLAGYALSIANSLLDMFEQTSFIGNNESELCSKLGLIRAAMQVLKNAFKVLGIELQIRI